MATQPRKSTLLQQFIKTKKTKMFASFVGFRSLSIRSFLPIYKKKILSFFIKLSSQDWASCVACSSIPPLDVCSPPRFSHFFDAPRRATYFQINHSSLHLDEQCVQSLRGHILSFKFFFSLSFLLINFQPFVVIFCGLFFLLVKKVTSAEWRRFSQCKQNNAMPAIKIKILHFCAQLP